MISASVAFNMNGSRDELVGWMRSRSVRGRGAASREAYRQLLHAVIAPVGRMVEAELREKLDPSIALDFGSLFAGDIMGRARAFQSMVGGGTDIAKVAILSGLMEPDGD